MSNTSIESLRTDPALHEHIYSLANGVYYEISVERGKPLEDIPKLGFCETFADRMIPRLIGVEGINSISREIRVGGPIHPYDHHYLLIGINGLQLVLDGTWQQFLPKTSDTSGLDKLAFGVPDEVLNMAIYAGVSQEDAYALWGELDDDFGARSQLVYYQ